MTPDPGILTFYLHLAFKAWATCLPGVTTKPEKAVLHTNCPWRLSCRLTIKVRDNQNYIAQWPISRDAAWKLFSPWLVPLSTAPGMQAHRCIPPDPYLYYSIHQVPRCLAAWYHVNFLKDARISTSWNNSGIRLHKHIATIFCAPTTG